MLTVRDILNTSLSLLFESEGSAPDYIIQAPVILSSMVPEVFDINKGLRASKGLPPLEVWPQFKNLDDEILFEPELCRAALPYGLATNLLLADEEDARAINYNAKYADAVNLCMRLIPEPISDVYPVPSLGGVS